ncbi:glutamate receptor 3-like isoform X2 [Amphibalanus amphitrite]|uniref:glutamate receptor 3-like isoform X2 n=1 Tax=Amphibalanus amphitrite TaxID=1232801 RepID=UPI001C90BE23|nr:glutamate receptor 3-like isoform X2 [Amphibalanus amphitrite]
MCRLVTMFQSNCTATVTDVWTFPNGQRPLFESSGHWSAAAGLCLRAKRAGGPASFQGRTIRFATSNATGDVIYDAANNGTLRKTGLHGNLIKFIEKKLQLRAEIVLARDEHLCRDPDSVLCGPLKLVRRRQAEVAVGQFRIRRASLDMVDFTPGLQDYSYSFVVANPNRQTSAAAVNWRAYSRPFSPAVWLCAAAMAALVWLIWCLVQRAADRRPPHLRDTAWSVLCILMQQGAELAPRSVSARQVVGCFWIFCVILLASYTSNIISLLVSVGRALPFSTLQELAGRRGWRVAVQPGGRADALLQGRTELQNHEIVYQSSLKDSLERILRDDKFTVFAGHTEADHLVRSSCSLVWTPLRLDVVHTHWALQKQLPYGARIANLRSRPSPCATR